MDLLHIFLPLVSLFFVTPVFADNLRDYSRPNAHQKLIAGGSKAVGSCTAGEEPCGNGCIPLLVLSPNHAHPLR